MADVDGEWECVTKTPMGAQQALLKVVSDGGSFTGTNVGPTGPLDVLDGVVDGNTLTWKMKPTKPFPMTVKCTATVDGDVITGTMSVGVMGKMAMTGKRKA